MIRFNQPLLGKSIVLLMLACASPAFAHTGAHGPTGFTGGLLHPLMGLDHLLAMLAVGLWAAQHRRPAIWVLPLVFPLAMTIGAVFGVNGFAIAGVEAGIAGSVAILGLLLAFSVRLPMAAGVSLISGFALAHGFAHGMEMPSGSSPWTYGAGFLLATALLHIAGMAAGLIGIRKSAASQVKTSGMAIAATGIYLLAAAV